MGWQLDKDHKLSGGIGIIGDSIARAQSLLIGAMKWESGGTGPLK